MKTFHELLAFLALFTFAPLCCGQTVPLAEVAEHAIDQSKLTVPAGTPFHLKATIVETTNPRSEYKGEIEEYWACPDRWRRSVISPNFSQTLIVNGNDISEDDQGDYLPLWLDNLVTAIFDPLPMADQLKQLAAQMQRPSGSEHSSVCSRLETKVGTPTAQNSAFLVFCFQGSNGLLQSVVTPGYEVSFDAYRKFKNKYVAHRLTMDPEPGTTIEAKITDLAELKDTGEASFTVERPSAPSVRLRSIRVSEATLRSLGLSTPDIIWPSVRSGKTSGVLSMFVSVDRNGRVRETWPLNSDNAGLEDPAREQVMRWRFKTATSDGAPVQVESVITLAFSTKVGDAIAILSDEEARKLAVRVVEPSFPADAVSATVVKIQIGVALDGTVNGVSNPHGAPTQLFLAAYNAVRQWRFRPYMKNGTPDLFGADITFRVP
jgi:hypothetical protein